MAPKKSAIGEGYTVRVKGRKLLKTALLEEQLMEKQMQYEWVIFEWYCCATTVHNSTLVTPHPVCMSDCQGERKLDQRIILACLCCLLHLQGAPPAEQAAMGQGGHAAQHP